MREDFSDASDIDILVEYTETPSLFDFIRLKNHLSDLLGRGADLVMSKTVKARIKDSIMAETVAT